MKSNIMRMRKKVNNGITRERLHRELLDGRLCRPDAAHYHDYFVFSPKSSQSFI